MGITLFEHNRAAYEAALALMDRRGKAAVIHPTGTGKSFIGFCLCEEHPRKTVCWLSPSEYIFRTQKENWEEAGGRTPKNIHFYTYAKLMLMDTAELQEMMPDYIVLDEFHRCGAKMWGQGVERLLALYPDALLLGLSATNIRYLDNQRDMADELFEGSIASEMTLGEAIVRGILNPPKYVLSVFSYRKELEQYEARIRSAKSKAVRDAARKALEALRRALEMADGMDEVFFKHMPDTSGKYIVFCANYGHMQEMMKKVPEWFGKVDQAPHVYSVYSEEPGTDRAFMDFKADNGNHLKLLFCIDMLNEGIHVDDVSGVILLRPTVSPIIYKQQIGRALSANKKRNAVIFDIVLNIENLYSIGAIEEEMQAVVEQYCSQDRESKIVHRHFEVIDQVRDCIRLFQRLEGTLSASWDLMFEAAKEYYQEHGNLEIPKSYVNASGLSLGVWLETQRRVYAKKVNGRLTGNQVDQLESIGMRWQGAWDFAWDRNFAEAEKYYRKHGNLLIEARETVNGIALGQWLAQLRIYKKNHAPCLTQERIMDLERIHMVWDISEYLWEKNYAAAVRYYQEHGDLDVPSAYVDKNGIHLGSWILKMRRERRKAEQQESKKNRDGAVQEKSRYEKLEAIGMIWGSKRDMVWEKNYTAAENYQKMHGNLDIPVSYTTEEGLHLGKWIRHQREEKERLSQERKEKLSDLGMTWERPDSREKKQKNIRRTEEAWQQQYHKAREFYRENNHLKVPRGYVGAEGKDLGVWVQKQRKKYQDGILAKEQAELLEEIGMVWNKKNPWEIGYDHAKSYCMEFGSLEVPSAYICSDGYRLGRWIANQRRAYKGALGRHLTKVQEEKLTAIGMVWSMKKSQWEENYEREYGEYPSFF